MQSDLEISKALALAIGWLGVSADDCEGVVKVLTRDGWWRKFDYTDWNVIGPIAERYDAFPFRNGQTEWWASVGQHGFAQFADTPQKCIAMAVINRSEK